MAGHEPETIYAKSPVRRAFYLAAAMVALDEEAAIRAANGVTGGTTGGA